MSATYDVIDEVSPNYREERRKRNEIRLQCRKLLNGLETGGVFELIDSEDRELSYVSDDVEEHCLQAEFVFREKNLNIKNCHVRFAPSQINDKEEKEISEHLSKAIDGINDQNKWSKRKETGWIVFTILVIGGSIGIGITGVESIIAFYSLIPT